MRISESGLKTFKKLYAARFGENLNETDALRKAQSVLNIFEAIFGSPFEVGQKDMEDLQTNKQNEYEETKKEK